MRLTVLGSGTLLPDAGRGSPAYWVEAGGAFLLMDCGAGALRSMARFHLPWGGVSHLLISHFHTDHVGEVAPLLFALRHGLPEPREVPLFLLGPPGLRAHLLHLCRAHGSFVLEPGFPLQVVELPPEGGWDDPQGRFLLRSHPTRHTEGSLAFRIETPAGRVGYTGDTGPVPGLGSFLAGCRLLVAECSHPDGAGTDAHLTPSSLAVLAEEAAPELLLTAHGYPPLDPEEVPELLRALGYRGAVRAARDGMAVRLLPGELLLEVVGGEWSPERLPG